MSKMNERQKSALVELEMRAEVVAVAREKYDRAIFDARDAGLTNTQIARALGITEGGVRMFFRRKEQG